LEELKGLIVGICEGVRKSIGEAVRETNELAMHEQPQLRYPLAELIWKAARTGKAANLRIFGAIFPAFYKDQHNSTPLAAYMKTENSQITAKLKEYECEMLNLHLQLHECELSVLSKQGEIEKLNNLLVVKCRKLE
jgi:hypothetical protein